MYSPDFEPVADYGSTPTSFARSPVRSTDNSTDSLSCHRSPPSGTSHGAGQVPFSRPPPPSAAFPTDAASHSRSPFSDTSPGRSPWRRGPEPLSARDANMAPSRASQNPPSPSAPWDPNGSVLSSYGDPIDPRQGFSPRSSTLGDGSVSGPQDYVTGEYAKLPDIGGPGHAPCTADAEEADAWRPYDAFETVEHEVQDDERGYLVLLKVLRVVLCMLLVLVILTSAMAARLSLLLLTSPLTEPGADRGQATVVLLLCVCMPLAWSWLTSVLALVTGERCWPSLPTFCVALILELAQTGGFCLLVFRVLPSTDFLRGVTFTLAGFATPAFLKVALLDKRCCVTPGAWVKVTVGLIALSAQVGGIVYFYITDFLTSEDNFLLRVLPASMNATSQNVTTNVTSLNLGMNVTSADVMMTPVTWEGPTSLLLISLGWWENFVAGNWVLWGRACLPFRRWRRALQEQKAALRLLTTPFSVGLAVQLARYLTQASFHDLPHLALGSFSLAKHLHQYSLLYLCLGSSALCTYLGGLACRLHMQRTAFAVPIMLATPLDLALTYAQCRLGLTPTVWHVGGWVCPRLPLDSLLVPGVCAGVLWLSFCLIHSHVWFPRAERMASIEKLFVTPHFSALFPDFHLASRRRRNDRELRPTANGRFRYVGEEEGDDEDDDDEEEEPPTVYVCVTMWHESRAEMLRLLKSLFRLDFMNCASRLAQKKFHVTDPDFFHLEIHMVFDDAFEPHPDSSEPVPNHYVRQMAQCVEEAARCIIKGPIFLPPPTKVPTPYGGRLEWTMPGQTKMIVHLKDKNKIRHRKRWSQCMYLYYLLGFRLLGVKDDGDNSFTEENRKEAMKSIRNRKPGKIKRSRKQQKTPLKYLLMRLPPEKYEKVVRRAENTFVLTVDGDVHFKPEAVRTLVERLRKDRKVAAVCGRVHPYGTGPMVWYQQFEYAVGHWLQKAAEHVFGCVLCCPGCFSLFRGSALMDDNVLKMYTTKPTEASQYIQYENGEDRWLCTLLMKQGHKLDYCAGADVHTAVPETFTEFLKQRRRWLPSTLANVADLLTAWRYTVRSNQHVSRVYVLYQYMWLLYVLLAPSTVVLMVASSMRAVSGLPMWLASVLALAPVLIAIVACLTQTYRRQVQVLAVLTAVYTGGMMVASVSTIVSLALGEISNLNVLLLVALSSILLLSALLHPHELPCLFYSPLFFMTAPATFVLVTVFYVCNLHDMEWGTREAPEPPPPVEEGEVVDLEAEEERDYSLVRDSLRAMYMGLVLVKRAVCALVILEDDEVVEEPLLPLPDTHRNAESPGSERQPGWAGGDSEYPGWCHEPWLGKGGLVVLGEEEAEFWRYTLHKYLAPLPEDSPDLLKITHKLIRLRNQIVLVYLLLNFVWSIITLQLRANEELLRSILPVHQHEPLTLVFMGLFALCLLLQFLSMLVHRWSTFLHLMSATRIDWIKASHSFEEFSRFVVSETERLQSLEPESDVITETSATLDSSEPLTDADMGGQGDDGLELVSRNFRNSRLLRYGPEAGRQGPLLESILDHNLDFLRTRYRQQALPVSTWRRWRQHNGHRSLHNVMLGPPSLHPDTD